MQTTEMCPICGGHSEHREAPVSKFIVSYVFDGTEPKCSIRYCRACCFAFHSVRYEEHEIEKLYAGYRGEKYNRERKLGEPDYELDAQQSHGEVSARRATINKLLARFNGSILDYGGDHGQHIPAHFSEKYVYDKSGVEPEPGVIALRHPADKAPYDVVMATHVLEHVSDPVALLSEIRSLVRPTGVVFVEIPVEFTAKDHVMLPYAKPRFAPALSEHINFFTKRSMDKLTKQSGLSQFYSRYEWIFFENTAGRQVISQVHMSLSRREIYSDSTAPSLLQHVGDIVGYTGDTIAYLAGKARIRAGRMLGMRRCGM